jgi:hypothetical protein
VEVFQVKETWVPDGVALRLAGVVGAVVSGVGVGGGLEPPPPPPPPPKGFHVSKDEQKPRYVIFLREQLR